MNTTPILTAAALLAASAPAFCQEDPFGPQPPAPKKLVKPVPRSDTDPFAAAEQDAALIRKVTLDVENIPLPELIDYLQEQIDQPLNFVLKGPAHEVIVPKMRIRNVALETLLETIEQLAELRIGTVRGRGDGAPVVIIEAPPRRGPNVPHLALPGAGDSMPAPTPAEPGPVITRVIDPHAPEHPITRSYAIRPLLETIEFPSLVDLIEQFWNSSAPDWPRDNALALHEATGMLIVKAPPPRHEELAGLLEGLGSSLEDARHGRGEIEEIRKQMRELEHRAEMAMRTAEEQRAVREASEARLRLQIEEREQQIIQLDRMIAELKQALEAAETRQ